MRRREFIKGNALAVAWLAVGSRSAQASKVAPDYMPILEDKMAEGRYIPCYEERELTEPVFLCDENGNLNPEAIGWSRVPLTRANLKGHWPRKKKWNFWNWISPGFVFSITISDIDFASFCAVSLTDFETRESIDAIALKPHSGVVMPEQVEESISFSSKAVEVSMIHKGYGIKVECHCPNMKGKDLRAEFLIHKPRGHETLNIVVPWTCKRFQMNSKHNTLPTEGVVMVDGKKYVMDPDECHGVQDFGRGMWPYRSYWNWAVCTGKQGRDLIGVNMGAKWTTGTGSNENGICYNGRLYKVMEDLIWEYDCNDWMKPWRMRTGHSDMINMTLTPFYEKTTKINLGLIGTGGTCVFGNWKGVINFDGKTVEIDNLIGWAEEFAHKW